MIDTEVETPKNLHIIAKFLAALAGDEAGESHINGPSDSVELIKENAVAPIDELALFRAANAVRNAPPLPPAGVALFTAPIPPVPPAPPVPSASIVTAPAGSTANLTLVPAAVPVVNFTQRDGSGIPWDERIHSSSKAVTKEGTWRYRRGLDEYVKAAVETELRAKYAAVPQGTTTPVIPVVSPQPQQIPQAVPPIPPAPVSLPPVPVPPSAPVGLPNPPQSPVLQGSPPVTSYRDLLTKIAIAVSGQKLTQAQVEEACQAAGIQGGINGLAAQPMLVPTVDAYLNQYLGA
jgi:hypothetical protein